MNIDVKLSIPDVSGLNSETIMARLRAHADEIASTEHTKIAGRSPEDTGTLILSLTQEVNPEPATLMRIYTDPEAQLSGPWHRVYAQYQEGPPLGHSTYTNDARHFFYDAIEEDLPDIALWAMQSIEKSTNIMVEQANEKLKHFDATIDP